VEKEENILLKNKGKNGGSIRNDRVGALAPGGSLPRMGTRY
jgi:hypothetical protein